MTVAGAKHIIQKQFMEIDFADSGTGLSVQNELSELFYEKLLPQMEMLFDEFGNQDYLISFDTLQIDVGNIPAKHWEAVLVEETVKILRQELLSAHKIKLSSEIRSKKTEEAFLFFLEFGRLPWNSSILSIVEFEHLTPDKELGIRVKRLIQRKTAIIERLVNNFSDQFINYIIESITESRDWRQEANRKEEYKFENETRKEKSLLLKNLCSDKEIMDLPLDSDVKENSQKRSVKKSIEVSEEIYIHNAGLVILHPFLFELFKSLNLYDENGWHDESSNHLAIHILEYLVTGTDECPEFYLPLNKILCGIEPVEAAKPVTPLSLEIKTECDNMLQAVFQHWSALKNSSVEALRETYLQRFGKLVASDHAWSLEVEPKAVDILVGRLPWGIGTIRLPWMKSILFTEWN